MKKQWLLIAALGMSITLPASAAISAATMEIGEVVGQVFSTDIQAFVNGSRIPSMNVNGYTAVAAEDLRQYGFDVAWIPQRRQLVISYREGKQQSPLPFTQSNEAVGTKLADVLYTDIEAHYGNTKIQSYNIGGKTAILLNDLETFGQVVWSEKERKLTFTPAPTKETERPAANPLALRQTGSVNVDGIAIGDETISYQDSEIGRIVNGKPMISVRWMAERFGYDIEEVDDMLYVKSSTYSFSLRTGDTQSDRYWFGSPAGKNRLFVAPVKIEGDWLVNETDLKQLFGYYSVWDPETRKLNIDYRVYEAEDYGLPEIGSNYFYYVFVDGYISGYAGIPHLQVMNRINGQNPVGGSGSGGLAGNGDSEPKYRLGSSSPMDFGRNELEVSLMESDRLLFYKSFVIDMSMEQVKPIIDYNGPTGFGEYTLLKTVNPEQAYVKTAENEIHISGVVGRKIGSGLTFTIEKQDGSSYQKVSDLLVPFEEDTYDAKLTLPEENGLYRVTAVSVLTNPRGTSSIAVAKWYVEKSQ